MYLLQMKRFECGDESSVCELVFIKKGEDPDGVGEDRRLRVSRDTLMQFEYFKTSPSFALSSHREEPSNRFVIVDVDPQVAAVVLQVYPILSLEIEHFRPSMITSLTKDNFIDTLVALEYFTGGCSYSILERVAMMTSKEFQGDSAFAMALLQSLDQPPIGRLIISTCNYWARGLTEMVLDHPECIRPLYDRVAGDEARQAAIVLIDRIYLGKLREFWGAVAVTERLERFLTVVTNSQTFPDALYKVFADRQHSLQTHTVMKPFLSDGSRSSVRLHGWRLALPVFKGQRSEETLPSERTVTEVTRWEVPTNGRHRTGCYSISGAFAIEREGQPPVTLHGSDEFTSSMRVTINDGHEPPTKVLNLAADELVRKGVGDVRLKEVKLRLTETLFLYASLAMQYLQCCIEQGKWREINNMSRALGRDARETVLGHLTRVEYEYFSHPMIVIACWCSGSITQQLSPELSSSLAKVDCGELRTTNDDIGAFLDHVVPLMQPRHQQYCPVIKMERSWASMKAGRGADKDLRRTVRSLQSELASKNAEIAQLKAKLAQVTRNSGVSSTDKASTTRGRNPTSADTDSEAPTTTSIATNMQPGTT
ncbi:unnamed protein product [Vitrella brassicaformis CCMP3155]|uniref:Uncharacterized protein n=2 Tax=Vitrella brassicaformis TaxID=1169539 RepID=A0A0G4EFT0_VITBC|nr:unnamed protein product [Vitrella brassicaformis CCMP3155]|eukprot:CEL94279.1 unnamed protein product [Vitrella brassicaformis CCMP3155]